MHIGIILTAIAVPVIIEIWLGSSRTMLLSEIGLGELEDDSTEGRQSCWTGAVARVGLMILGVAAAVFGV